LAATGLEWPLAAFAVSQWLAVATSMQPRLGLEWAAGLTAWLAAFWLVHDLLRAGWPRDYLVNGLLLVAALLGLHAAWSAAAWYAAWLAAGEWPPVTYRYAGLLGHANLTACVVNLLLPLVIVRTLTASSRLARLALALLAAALLAALFFTSSRAGWIAAAATLGTLALLLTLGGDLPRRLAPWHARWRALAPALRLALLVLGASLAAVAGWLLLRQSQHITHGSLFQSRQPFWGPAWERFRQRPLTGYGPDLFPWYYSRTQSAPPAWFAPHAHSLVMQVLSGSGLVGAAALTALALAAGGRLWRAWRRAGRPLLAAGCLAALAGLAVQHLFDYLLGTPFVLFLVIVIAALALSAVTTAGAHSRTEVASSESRPPTPPSPGAGPQPAADHTLPRLHPATSYPALTPLFPVAALMAASAVFTFSLRAEARYEAALTLAARGDWPTAAAAFEQAAALDPGLTLYWQSAAYARTRAGDVAAALPLWARSARDDPYWALLPATLAVLERDPALMVPALDLASQSHLLHLNYGALAEAAGDAVTARTAFSRALALRPAAAAALFWQQTALRRSTLAEWQAAQPPDTSALGAGQAALVAGDASAALAHFERALAANPGSHLAYAGLARAASALGHIERAGQLIEAGLRLPFVTLEETLPLRLLRGDLAAATGDDAAARRAYAEVFSAVADYTVYGPGTYGYPQRSWYVFHRAALPSDLVPQFARADITGEMDARFASLIEWHLAHGEQEVACLIALRVWREAPQSASGALAVQQCAVNQS
jgi:O-antigen ligase